MFARVSLDRQEAESPSSGLRRRCPDPGVSGVGLIRLKTVYIFRTFGALLMVSLQVLKKGDVAWRSGRGLTESCE